MKKYTIFCCFILMNVCSSPNAASLSENSISEQYIFKRSVDLTDQVDTKKFLTEHVIDNQKFFGLASYYNSVRFFVVEPGYLKPLSAGEVITLHNNEWFAAVGRFNVLVFKVNGAVIKIEKNAFVIAQPRNQTNKIDLYIVEKPNLVLLSTELDQIRYSHLWFPIAILAKSIEWSMIKIHQYFVDSWVVSIFVLGFLIKLLLLPIGFMTTRLQSKVSQHQAILVPRLNEIKLKYGGEEAHKKSMLVYKSLGITPFYTLKPMLGLMIQIPIWVATFNVLGEMYQLSGVPFLWIDDIAYPDTIANFSGVLPLLGDRVSILPCLMTIIAVISVKLSQNSLALSSELRRQKRNLYVMAIVFFVLFYPFPASMLIYWTTNNLLHLIQQQITNI